jgi:hypothetical protein
MSLLIYDVIQLLNQDAMSRSKSIMLVLALVVTLCACSPRKLAVREITAIAANGMTALEQDDDLDMLAQALPANIKLLEMVLASSPDDAELLTLLARSYGSYNFMILEPKFEKARFDLLALDANDDIETEVLHLKQTVSRYYQKGAAYALKALEVDHPDTLAQLKNVSTIDAFMRDLGPRDVAAVFWYGFNLAAWVNLNLDSVQALSQGHIAEKCMHRVIELQPAYFNGAAHLVLIAYYASRSPMLGGNLDAARRHYDALKQISGDAFLMADLFYARYYLQRTQDRPACESLLDEIERAAGQKSAYPLFNKVAGHKAHIYLTALNELFE